jgi:protein involved in polysaccharide export with SLBB domain
VKEIFNVSVNGEVRRPGTFTYTPNITLKDLVLMAGGFTDAAAPQRIEISRRVRTDSFDLNDTRIAEVIEVGTGTDLTTSNADITLQPWDVVTIRRNPGYRQQVNVSVTGEVVYPGPYVIQSRTERVSDLIKRAGGLTAQASQKGVFLQRLNNSAIGRDTSLSAVKKIMRAVDDTTNAILQDITASTVKVGLSLEQILKNPRGDEDVFLQEGDVLNVTKAVLEVKINGEVMFPTQVVYKEGEDLLYYIDKAGGFTDDARKKKTYVLYSNGNASKTRRFLFIKNYPRIEPGAEVLVPKIPERKKQRLSTGEVVAITSGVASLVGVVVALLNFVK